MTFTSGYILPPSIGGKLVPVGTMVTHRPSARSVRAALPHTAPIGCCDGEPSIWMRVQQATWRQVFAKQPLETIPRQPVSLASTHQSVSPSSTNFPTEPSQSLYQGERSVTLFEVSKSVEF